MAQSGELVKMVTLESLNGEPFHVSPTFMYDVHS